MTLPEQAGKVATSVVDGLKASPSCLAALVIVGIFAGLQFFEGQRAESRAEKRLEAVQQLLNQCFDRTNSILKENPP
jgi:hypothetical protein